MDLKKLMVDTKAVWVDFPGLKGLRGRGSKPLKKRT